MSLSKRLRFEVLKRDGFRCRYCGATAISSLLHVDHVVPQADGGSDDPVNLIAACADCNLGKSDVPLDESRLKMGPTPEEMVERAEQVRAYLATLVEFEAAREELREHYSDVWRGRLGSDPPAVLHRRWDTLDAQYGREALIVAMDAVSIRSGLRGALNEAKYFYGVLRNMRSEGRA